MIVFASPGMLHAGYSLHLFKKWATDEKNMVRACRVMFVFIDMMIHYRSRSLYLAIV
jgi:predicted metal-dependent RNase